MVRGGDDEDDEDGGLPVFDKHSDSPVYVEAANQDGSHNEAPTIPSPRKRSKFERSVRPA
ncbi:hypothetical protein PM082_004526 [Marasmius tenuissimus]|nr:hypothetical protein PM082_004526 [Marasmius tenuissimus]